MLRRDSFFSVSFTFAAVVVDGGACAVLLAGTTDAQLCGWKKVSSENFSVRLGRRGPRRVDGARRRPTSA
jgi:hypothetical protein